MAQHRDGGTPSDRRPLYEQSFKTIGRIIERDADKIIERWYERARKEQLHAGAEHRETLMDQLLSQLRSLGRRLQEETGLAFEQSAGVAREHGQGRWESGWDIAAVVRDYQILHQVTLEHIGQTHGELLSYREVEVIALMVDMCIGSSVEQYSRSAQEKLEGINRELTLQLTDAEYHFRQQVAATLHDDLQQMLVALRMQLDRALSQPDPDRSAVREARDLLDETIQTARNLTSDLHPQILERAGLGEALEWLAESYAQRHGLRVELDLAPDIDPGLMPLRLLLFDAVRELLFNVVKHARTDRARVQARREASRLTLIVEDRGTGSRDLHHTDRHAPGFGLANIRQRIDRIGGQLIIESTPGQGTRVTLTAPLE